ncbi:NAD(P)-dependent oxidoreductase [Streptomyces sp. NBC_01637]|uniref:NAD(P)-dependent oxidoreductase n=1 Tax=unclassified Streptomyces TaxID=2593676 RepID=UPI003865552B|nr:NAD(P)-dependent oxidoreductase [Streptomyces sp. NBC_01653]WTD93261.1 NAD(P)-dependent oxidoreductase [Streptomyces sp. NBC_01637]
MANGPSPGRTRVADRTWPWGIQTRGLFMSHASTVAVLGAGALGAAMAMRLGDTGHEVRLWNRTEERARSVAEHTAGVTAVRAVGDAVSGASVVVTVLRDGDAVTQVMSDAIGRLDDDAVWVQASTVGPRYAGALAGLARDHGVAYLDAPVSGSTAPARQGKLVWLVSGAEDVLTRARPLLDDLGSSVLHVGTKVEGSAVKLVVNAWMAASTVAMSDVLALCDALGVDHATFVRVLEAGPLAMPYELQKVGVMDDASYAPGFAVQLALKDIELAAAAATPSPLLQAVRDRLEATVAAGHDNDDLAAVDYLRRPPS